MTAPKPDLLDAIKALAEPAPEDLRSSAYYFSFDLTGVGIIDRILDALCRAGKGYHNTDGWTEPTYVQQEDGTYASTGPSYEEQIQRAANDAADALRALLAGATTSETVEGECGAEFTLAHYPGKTLICDDLAGHSGGHARGKRFYRRHTPAPVPTEGGEQP